MSCPQNFDWKSYALGELDPAAKREASVHLGSCERCSEELAGLQTTLATLSVLRDEELPRRIAFVSDKVFEPTLWQRLTQPLRTPMFASASVLALAILFHAAYTGGPSEAEVQARIDRAVNQAVAEQVSEEVEARTAGYNQMVRMVMPEMIKTQLGLTNN